MFLSPKERMVAFSLKMYGTFKYASLTNVNVKCPFENYFIVGHRQIFTQILAKKAIFAKLHLQIIKMILLVTDTLLKVIKCITMIHVTLYSIIPIIYVLEHIVKTCPMLKSNQCLWTAFRGNLCVVFFCEWIKCLWWYSLLNMCTNLYLMHQ